MDAPPLKVFEEGGIASLSSSSGFSASAALDPLGLWQLTVSICCRFWARVRTLTSEPLGIFLLVVRIDTVIMVIRRRPVSGRVATLPH